MRSSPSRDAAREDSDAESKGPLQRRCTHPQKAACGRDVPPCCSGRAVPARTGICWRELRRWTMREGHGLRAAARYTLRALADPDRGPAETVAEVNAKLLAQTDAERHCTLILGYLRPTDGGTSVTLTLAGHHPPLLLRTTGEVEEVGRLGTALALFDEPELHDTTLVMAPGEVCAPLPTVSSKPARGRTGSAPSASPSSRADTATCRSTSSPACSGRPSGPSTGPAPGRRCAAPGQGQRRRSSINPRPTRARGAAGGRAPSVPGTAGRAR